MKISKHIHSLSIPFKIAIGHDVFISRSVNVYIIESKNITLIDTGVAGSEKLIFEYLESIGRKPSDIKTILLTHTHPDHIGAAKMIKEQCHCNIYVHTSERNWLEDTELQFKERPVPGFHSLVAGSCKADYLLTNDDMLNIDDDVSIRAIHCPGHSAGSVAFLYQQDNALFTGDCIPVKGDIPVYDDYSKSLQSLENIENLPYAEYLLSAWDAPKIGEDVDVAISSGFEVLYDVHRAWLEVRKTTQISDIELFTQNVLKSLGLPNKFINPLFSRSLQSHK